VDSVQPEDIAVLIALAAHPSWAEARSLLLECLPEERLATSIERLKKARLCLPSMQRVVRPTLVRLLTHGVPFLFPASIGDFTLGVPTAWSDPRVIAGMGLVVPESHLVVWPPGERTLIEALTSLLGIRPFEGKIKPEPARNISVVASIPRDVAVRPVAQHAHVDEQQRARGGQHGAEGFDSSRCHASPAPGQESSLSPGDSSRFEVERSDHQRPHPCPSALAWGRRRARSFRGRHARRRPRPVASPAWPLRRIEIGPDP